MRRLLLILIVIIALLLVQQITPPNAQGVRTGCSGTLPTRLIVRERARVSPIGDDSPLNVRAAPGTDNEVLGRIPIGGVFFVLDGFECTQRYTWYQVEYEGITGWAAEGDAEVYFTEVYPPLP